MLRGVPWASILRRFRARYLRQKIASRVGIRTVKSRCGMLTPRGRQRPRPLDQGGRAASGDQWHQLDAASPRGLRRHRRLVFAVVAALHQHVGTQRFNELQRRVSSKSTTASTALQRRQHPRAILLADQRPRIPFSRRTERSLLSPTTRRSPVRRACSSSADVADMQQVEAAVGKARCARVPAIRNPRQQPIRASTLSSRCRLQVSATGRPAVRRDKSARCPPCRPRFPLRCSPAPRAVSTATPDASASGQHGNHRIARAGDVVHLARHRRSMHPAIRPQDRDALLSQRHHHVVKSERAIACPAARNRSRSRGALSGGRRQLLRVGTNCGCAAVARKVAPLGSTTTGTVQTPRRRR